MNTIELRKTNFAESVEMARKVNYAKYSLGQIQVLYVVAKLSLGGRIRDQKQKSKMKAEDNAYSHTLPVKMSTRKNKCHLSEVSCILKLNMKLKSTIDILNVE